MTKNLLKYARVGAELTLTKLDAERAEIVRAFPELKLGATVAPVKRVKSVKRAKRTISKALRAKMTAGVRRYWRERRAAAKKAA